jgi:CBS domain-containing protein
MIEAQVRRVPVVDAKGRCVGMIAQADLALNNEAASDREVGRMIERISKPAQHHARHGH